MLRLMGLFGVSLVGYRDLHSVVCSPDQLAQFLVTATRQDVASISASLCSLSPDLAANITRAFTAALDALGLFDKVSEVLGAIGGYEAESLVQQLGAMLASLGRLESLAPLASTFSSLSHALEPITSAITDLVDTGWTMESMKNLMGVLEGVAEDPKLTSLSVRILQTVSNLTSEVDTDAPDPWKDILTKAGQVVDTAGREVLEATEALREDSAAQTALALLTSVLPALMGPTRPTSRGGPPFRARRHDLTQPGQARRHRFCCWLYNCRACAGVGAILLCLKSSSDCSLVLVAGETKCQNAPGWCQRKSNAEKAQVTFKFDIDVMCFHVDVRINVESYFIMSSNLGAALDDALERLPADAQSHVVGALASAQMLAALFANATRAYNILVPWVISNPPAVNYGLMATFSNHTLLQKLISDDSLVTWTCSRESWTDLSAEGWESVASQMCTDSGRKNLQELRDLIHPYSDPDFVKKEFPKTSINGTAVFEAFWDSYETSQTLASTMTSYITSRRRKRALGDLGAAQSDMPATPPEVIRELKDAARMTRRLLKNVLTAYSGLLESELEKDATSFASLPHHIQVLLDPGTMMHVADTTSSVVEVMIQLIEVTSSPWKVTDVLLQPSTKVVEGDSAFISLEGH
nr:uncharacterized protein LOC113801925 [Penaeus vannamei]